MAFERSPGMAGLCLLALCLVLAGDLPGNAIGQAGPAAGPANAAAPALEISGDVYANDRPADGASLFVYVNDRPHGPIMAFTGRGPMFSVSIAGGHSGDRVTLTASKGDYAGIISQDVADRPIFLTLNLKNSNIYIPYSDATMPYER